MDERPEALLLKFPGTNCDRETARALRTVGFETTVDNPTGLDREQILSSDLIVFSGGFSYGDYVKAGRLARLDIRRRFGNVFQEFVNQGGFVLGICNGFQILLELNLLPDGSLVENSSERFMCQWVTLRKHNQNKLYLGDLPEQFELPIANMEGRFVAPDGKASDYLDQGLVPFVYIDNPNGSQESIAALQDESGRVFGMMPHPERFLRREHHYDPNWNGTEEWGWGYYFFKRLFDSVSELSVNRREAV